MRSLKGVLMIGNLLTYFWFENIFLKLKAILRLFSVKKNNDVPHLDLEKHKKYDKSLVLLVSFFLINTGFKPN